MITTVAVVARLRVYQELLSSLVGARFEFAVIAVAASESEATRMVGSQRPEIVLLDATLPGVWRVAQAAEQVQVRVVVFGLPDEFGPGDVAARAGCSAALKVGASSREVVEALERVRLVELDPVGASLRAHNWSNSLTRREVDVLRLVSQGLSNKQIAAELTVSLATVKSHVHSVLQKLGANRRTEVGSLMGGAHASALGSGNRSFRDDAQWLTVVPGSASSTNLASPA